MQDETKQKEQHQLVFIT